MNCSESNPFTSPEKLRHTFEPLRRDYFKRQEPRVETPFGPMLDGSVSYTMLYCTACGHTKEVVSADQRAKTP